MTSKNDSDAEKLIWKALQEQVHNRTYRLIDNTDKSGGGTAVAIKMGNNFFLLTAKHVIENDHDMEVLVRDQDVTGVSKFLARHTKEDADVGLIELDPNDSHLFVFATQTSLCPINDKKWDSCVLVCGYPGQLIHPIGYEALSDGSQIQYNKCDSFTLRTIAVPPSEWIKDWPGEDGTPLHLDPAHDLLVEFQPEGKIIM